MNNFTRHRRRIVGLTFAALLAACSNEPTASRSASIDAARTNGDVAALRAVLEQPAWRSFAALSGRFALGATGAAVAGSADIIDVIAAASAGDAPRLSASTTRVIVDRAADGASTVPAINPTRLGTTFVYDPAQHAYVADADRTGAPAGGVRFILYEMDPETGEPRVTSEIGHADLVDEGAARPSGIALHLTVVAGGVSLFDYRVTADGNADRGTLGVNGVVSDGVTRVTLDVAATARTIAEGSEGDVRFQIAIPDRAFAVNANAYGLESLGYRAGSMNMAIQSGVTSVGVALDTRQRSISGQFTINGRLFATVDGNAENPQIRGAGGRQLTAEERQMLGGILQLTGMIGEMLAALLGPVALAFMLLGMSG